ncbi:hypothetical protein M153_10655000863 [Pseudoloma neurophilia]|uniref:Uncharacterized protein n=1 Tax=Pseudoloma neurophilia TaxID=146866 RepID=A0A0R0LY47_9MICR|nr:hypothetical protein M153_10655000863 [Pseudoloma neurophilia]
MVSFKTIERTIDCFHFSLERISLIPERENTLETTYSRKMYEKTFLRLIIEDDGNNYFFVDKLCFQLSIPRTRDRSLRGTRETTTLPGVRSTNIDACAIISKHGILHYKLERNSPSS